MVEPAQTSATEEGPVYFWRPHEDWGFLGQWYESPFEHEGVTYVTAEMWMMVHKAKLFKDEEILKKMLATTNPKEQKALGRKVRNFNEQTWNEERLRIVVEGNKLKFTKGKDSEQLRKQLLATGERELIEASPLDRVWGIGFGAKNAEANKHRWGQNLLGKALMETRTWLREQKRESETK